MHLCMFIKEEDNDASFTSHDLDIYHSYLRWNLGSIGSLYRAILYGVRHGDAFHGSGYHISDMGLPHRARGGHRSRWRFPVGYWAPMVKPISIDHAKRAECPARLVPATVQ